MYDNNAHRDYVKTELEYRLNRVQSDLDLRALTARGDVPARPDARPRHRHRRCD